MAALYTTKITKSRYATYRYQRHDNGIFCHALALRQPPFHYHLKTSLLTK
uniref:Uncharacterized protein n=1 Tax=Rheinheimera sp. BAL341 TaxID=1708203 RepID=A0A486XKS8_9GAMM